MRLSQTLLSVAALSPLASAQDISAPVAEPSLTLDVIETRTTSFTDAQASLGNVTLYTPVPTVVAANATSGLVRFANSTATALPTGPVLIPAGNTTYTIPVATASGLPISENGAQPALDVSKLGYAALLGVAALLG